MSSTGSAAALALKPRDGTRGIRVGGKAEPFRRRPGSDAYSTSPLIGAVVLTGLLGLFGRLSFGHPTTPVVLGVFGVELIGVVVEFSLTAVVVVAH